MPYRDIACTEAPKTTVTRLPHSISQVPSISTQRGKPLRAWAPVQVVTGSLALLWFALTLPLRLAFWIVAWLGRLSAASLGFLLMVLGVALWAGPLFFVGISVFIVGLVLTLRCLE
jgi:hypothetical protein